MAGKRIRQLNPTPTPAPGAVLPLDAAGLDAAEAITPKDMVEAVSYTLTPVLGDDAEDNLAAIQDALDAYAASGNTRGTLRLPKGVYEVDYTVFLTGAHSGLTIEGDGCVLYRTRPASFPDYPENSVMNIGVNTPLDPMGRGDRFSAGPGVNQFQFEVEQDVRYDNYQVGDAIILYKNTNPGGTRQPVQQVAIITAKDVPNRTITVDASLIADVNLATYLFNGRKVVAGGIDAGATFFRIPGVGHAALFPKQSWVYVTDGVGELETYGEFARVKEIVIGIGFTDIYLETALRNSYLDGRAAVVPPSPESSPKLRSRWLEDITVRGLTFGGAPFANGQNADLAAKFSVNLTLERVNCVLRVAIGGVTSNGFIVATSGGLVMRQCYGVEGGQALALNGIRDSLIEKCRVTTSMEEFSSKITFRDCDIVRAYNQLFGTAQIAAIDCQFWNLEQFVIGDDSSMIRCKVIGSKTDGSGSLGIGSNRFTARDVEAIAGPMRLLFLSGTGHHVGRVRGNDPDEPVVTVVAGSGGRIDGPVIDGTVTAEGGGSIPIPGSWMYPTDAQVPLTFPADAPTSLQVIGKLSGLRSEMWLRITLVASGYGVSITRIYEIARSYQYPAQWYLCQPQSERRREYDLVNRTVFDLELHEGEVDAWLRLRRAGGLVGVDVIVHIETNATFTSGVTAPSGDPDDFQESTTVSQRNGLVYFCTRNTAPAIDDLKAKECALWYDPSDTAPRLVVRARTNDGTLANLALALTPEP